MPLQYNDRDIFGLPIDDGQKAKPYWIDWHPASKVLLVSFVILFGVLGMLGSLGGGYGIMGNGCFPSYYPWMGNYDMDLMEKTNHTPHSHRYVKYVYLVDHTKEPLPDRDFDDFYSMYYYSSNNALIGEPAGKWIRVQ